FNMGIGFCVVVPEREEERARQALAGAGEETMRLGCVAPAASARVILLPHGLVGDPEVGAFREAG
ncbi:MAG: hypothetical protein HY320_07605, partial [Armatimonadetes bacterium]|nr:hypothetical protein [Armatimonadota bacterium]